MRFDLVNSENKTTQTYLIVGLGNPGLRYRHNRHNIGLMIVDHLAARLEMFFSRGQFNALVADGRYKDKKLIITKPQTYMNFSGKSVDSLVKYYKLPLEKILITYDDVDLPYGSIRMRPQGGSGGQKGMKSIISSLGTEDFPRLRMGIGRPPGRMDAATYVLKDFSKEEAEELSIIVDQATDAILSFIIEGIEQTMAKCNRNDW